MSYILDALKKAEQEREQGQVPGLHSQPQHGADEPTSPGGLSPLTWAGVGVALTLAGVLTWHQWLNPSAPTAPAPNATRPQPPAQTPHELPPVARAAPLASPVPPATPSPAPATANTGWAAQPALSVSGSPSRASVKSDAARQGRNDTDAPADRPPTAPEGPLPAWADLPESTRRELPSLTVGGAMYAAAPSQRMLVLNGQVFHEGDSPQPGLQLVEIRLKSAVMAYKGQRFVLAY